MGQNGISWAMGIHGISWNLKSSQNRVFHQGSAWMSLLAISGPRKRGTTYGSWLWTSNSERVLKYQMPQELIWQCVKTLVPLVNPKIAGTWMFIPKKTFIGIDTSPYQMPTKNHMPQLLVAPKKSRCARDILLVFTMESPRSCQRFCPPGCAITLGGIEKKSSKDQHLKWWTGNELIMKWR